MKLLANGSYGYQITDHIHHTRAKYLSDEKKHAAIICNFFKKFYYVNNALQEVDLAKTQIEHIELIIIGFFTLQNAKLRKMELYYTFFVLQPNSVT